MLNYITNYNWYVNLDEVKFDCRYFVIAPLWVKQSDLQPLKNVLIRSELVSRTHRMQHLIVAFGQPLKNSDSSTDLPQLPFMLGPINLVHST